MEKDQAIDILTFAVQTVLVTASPVLASALAIGLCIAFFQALTQIQEMTLTFVPKIVAILVVLIVALPFMFSQVGKLGTRIFDMIASGAF